MPGIRVFLDDDPLVVGREVGLHEAMVVQGQKDWTISSLKNGMQSGKTSISLFVPFPNEAAQQIKEQWNGEQPIVMFAETSLQVLMNAMTMFRAKHEDELNEPGYAVVPDSVKAVLKPRYAEMIRRVCRVKIGKITKEMSEELAEAFIDGLAVGAPPEAFGPHTFNG